jgi:hypothetical protein
METGFSRVLVTCMRAFSGPFDIEIVGRGKAPWFDVGQTKPRNF